MRFVRFGRPGQERPGLLDADDRIRDLGPLLKDIDLTVIDAAKLAALRGLDLRCLPAVDGPVRLGTPWTGIGKIIAVGLNYRAHAAEAGLAAPTVPVLFPKWTSCLSGPDDDIVIPHPQCLLDWEVELGIAIGRRTRRADEAQALDHVFGYCLANDVSDRHQQFNGGAGQWGKGKGFDTFGPVGPWLVTADEVGDPQTLDLWLDVNGKRMQQSNTADMIFSCAEIVSHCSHFMTLEPGDLIITGTPAGVGMGFSPARYLAEGDRITLGIRGLGEQSQRVVRGPAARISS